jgi:hypothetical protein
METIQSKATMSFLAARGFNRNMPREVVFAPRKYQGLNFHHLYDLQGSDGVRLFIQEMNNNASMTQRMLAALLDTIQLESGIGDPIMEICRPLVYIEWGWIPHLRDFLYHINGKIIGATEKPPIYRINDTYIMDAPALEEFTIREKIYIHRCRLYLQVETLSDIATVSGTHIHKSWFSATSTKPSQSKLRWPAQEIPGDMAWKAWKRFLHRISSPTGKLKTNLGPWIKNNPSRRFFAYISRTDHTLWMHQESSWTIHRCIKHL